MKTQFQIGMKNSGVTSLYCRRLQRNIHENVALYRDILVKILSNDEMSRDLEILVM